MEASMCTEPKGYMSGVGVRGMGEGGGGVAPLDGAHGRGEMECYRLTAQRGAARCVGGGLEE